VRAANEALGIEASGPLTAQVDVLMSQCGISFPPASNGLSATAPPAAFAAETRLSAEATKRDKRGAEEDEEDTMQYTDDGSLNDSDWFDRKREDSRMAPLVTKQKCATKWFASAPLAASNDTRLRRALPITPHTPTEWVQGRARTDKSLKQMQVDLNREIVLAADGPNPQVELQKLILKLCNNTDFRSMLNVVNAATILQRAAKNGIVLPSEAVYFIAEIMQGSKSSERVKTVTCAFSGLSSVARSEGEKEMAAGLANIVRLCDSHFSATEVVCVLSGLRGFGGLDEESDEVKHLVTILAQKVEDCPDNLNQKHIQSILQSWRNMYFSTALQKLLAAMKSKADCENTRKQLHCFEIEASAAV
jgi:hypothetical protein